MFSQGKRTENQLMPYIHIPGEMPFYVKDRSKLKVICDEGNKWRAAVLNHFVPEFDETVTLTKGMPASSSELKLGPKEPVGTVLHSVAPGPSKEALQPSSSSKDDAKLPGASTDDETKLVDIALRGKPLPDDHNKVHWPRRPDACDVCRCAVKHFAPKRRFCNLSEALRAVQDLSLIHI